MASFTLRKALRIKKQIEAALNSPVNHPTVEMDIDDPDASKSVKDFLAAQETKYIERVERQVRLSHILSSLRASIDEANSKSGVSALLAEAAHVDRQIALFKVIAATEPTRADIVAARFVRKRESSMTAAPSVGYGRSSSDAVTVSAGVLSEQTINEYKARLIELRKRKQAIEDSRLGINNRDEFVVEIGDDDVKFLAELDIV